MKSFSRRHSRKHARSMLSRLVDHFFGYDFFVSYSHADGKEYPQRLAQALTARRFSVFLDADVYAVGDALTAATDRRVRQSRRLVVICGPGAVRSSWVRLEAEAFAQRRETPLVIEWDSNLATDEEAHWLRDLVGDSLTLREPVPRADVPVPETVEQLIRSFRVRRVERVRSALFGGAAVVFAALALVAWISRNRAVAEARRAISAREAVESRLALGNDPQRAVGLAACAMSSEALPVARESLVAAVRATWGVDAVFRARSGSLRESVLVPSTGALVATGQAGILWEWTDGASGPIAHQLPLSEDLTALALAADGRRLLVGSTSGTLLILDARTLRPSHPPINLHGAGLSRILVIGPQLVATVGYDDALVFLDPDDGRIVARPPTFHRPGRLRLGIQDAAYDPVRQRIATAGADGLIGLWDVSDPRRTRLLATAGPAGPDSLDYNVWFSVAIDPLNGFVAAGDGAGRLRIWRQKDESLLPIELAVPDRPADTARLIAGLAFDPASEFLAVSRFDGSLGIWDVGGDPERGDLPGPLLESVAHGSSVNRVGFTAPAQALTAADDGHVVRWALRRPRMPPLPFRPSRASDSSAVFAPRGRFVVSWDERNVVTVVDLRSRSAIGSITYDHEARIWKAAVSADGEKIALGDETGTVTVWATRTGRALLSPLSIHSGNVTSLAFEPSSGRWLLSGAVDGTVMLIRMDGSQPEAERLTRLAAPVSALTVSADGTTAAAVPSTRGATQVWRTRDWARFGGDVAADPESAIRGAALDPHGNRLALADRWGAVLLFERHEDSWSLRRLAHGGQVRAVSFSPDGETLASGGDDGGIVVWSASTGERQWGLPHAQARLVDEITWAPDSTALISVGDDGSVAFWPVTPAWWTGRAAEIAPSFPCAQ
jgi:WD40 repeat protein